MTLNYPDGDGNVIKKANRYLHIIKYTINTKFNNRKKSSEWLQDFFFIKNAQTMPEKNIYTSVVHNDLWYWEYQKHTTVNRECNSVVFLINPNTANTRRPNKAKKPQSCIKTKKRAELLVFWFFNALLLIFYRKTFTNAMFGKHCLYKYKKWRFKWTFFIRLMTVSIHNGFTPGHVKLCHWWTAKSILSSKVCTLSHWYNFD